MGDVIDGAAGSRPRSRRPAVKPSGSTAVLVETEVVPVVAELTDTPVVVLGGAGPAPGARGAEPGADPAVTGTTTLAGDVLRYSRYPLIILTLVTALDQADRFLLSSLYPLLQQAFHLSDTQLGVLSSAFTVVGGIAVIPFGMLVDRTVRTQVVAWATAIWSTAVIFTGLAGSYTQLFFSRMFHGTAEAAYGPAAFSLISDYYPVEGRATALSIYGIGSIAGYVILPIGAVIATTWGWRAAFHFYAIPGFLLALFVARLPEPARGQQDAAHRKLESADVGTGSTFARLPTTKAWGMMLRIPTVLVMVVASFFGTFFLSGIGLWAVTFFVRYHGMTVVTASTAILLLGVGAIVGTVAGGKLGDRLLAKGIVNGRIFAAGSAGVAGTILLVPAFAVSSTPLTLVLFLLGAVTLTFPLAPLGAVRADVLHPDLRGRASSLFTLLNLGAGASAPVIFGVLSDTIGLRGALEIGIPGLGIGGLLLLTFGARYFPRDSAHMARQLAGLEMPEAEVAP